MAISLFAFEAMAVATAMPLAVRDLDGLAYYGWPFSAFLVTNVVGLVVAGQWGDRAGARPPLLAGVAVFGAGLIAAGTASSMWVFVVGRGLQGFGVGLATVAVFLIVATAYPDHVRPRALAVISAAYVLPALVGPVVSGAVAAYVSWRWVFLALVPMIAAGGLLLVPVLRKLPTPDRTGAWDHRRAVLAVAAGFGVVALHYGGNWAVGGSPAAGALLVAAGVVVMVLGLRGLLPAGTWRLRPGVPAVVGLRGLLAGAFYAVESTVPLVLVTVHGYSAVAAGLPLLMGALGWWAGAQLQGRLTSSRDVFLRWGFASLACCVAGLVPLCLPDAPGWPTYVLWALGGLGMGLAVPTTGVLVLDLSPEPVRGANSSSLQISDVVAAAVCTSLAGVFVGAAERGVVTLSVSVSVLCAGMAALAVVGALTATKPRLAAPALR
ncbi:MFS transporter [Saccharothrix obliqua]|uniref:MFS transporter n=1 Tax=Saccharothrix obliqua TaxID=2861747 RepID=UPI001C5D49A6|nr:MFS transporter [Saccharothrix obliqua]MBW4718804.1 MFS transporter [Saccharothrix obliqua]